MPRFDSDGKPDFQALMNGATTDLCAWCFDLLKIDDSDCRERALIERKLVLRKLKADDDTLRFSEEQA